VGDPPNTKIACGSLGVGLELIGGKHGTPKIMHPDPINPVKAVIELLVENGLIIINQCAINALRISKILSA
jgi:hypothetical protein